MNRALTLPIRSAEGAATPQPSPTGWEGHKNGVRPEGPRSREMHVGLWIKRRGLWRGNRVLKWQSRPGSGLQQLRRDAATTRDGFTLLELLLALAASVVIFSAIYGVFSKAVHLRNDANTRTRDSRLSTRAGAVLRNDLRNARVSGGTLAVTLTGSNSSSHGAFPGSLKFTTTTARDSGAATSAASNTSNRPRRGDLQEVEYYVAADPAHPTSKAGRLVRTVDTNLLAPVRETPPEETLLSGVTAMAVEFHDGQDWVQSWEFTTDNPALPEAVRVTIQQEDLRPPIIVLMAWTTQAATEAATSTATTTPATP